MSRTKRKLPVRVRRIKTFQEIRLNEGAKTDKLPVRKKRTKRYLPTLWDDDRCAAWDEVWRKKNR